MEPGAEFEGGGTSNFVGGVLTGEVNEPVVVEIVFGGKGLFVPVGTADGDAGGDAQGFGNLFDVDELGRAFGEEELELVGVDEVVEL